MPSHHYRPEFPPLCEGGCRDKIRHLQIWSDGSQNRQRKTGARADYQRIVFADDGLFNDVFPEERVGVIRAVDRFVLHSKATAAPFVPVIAVIRTLDDEDTGTCLREGLCTAPNSIVDAHVLNVLCLRKLQADLGPSETFPLTKTTWFIARGILLRPPVSIQWIIIECAGATSTRIELVAFEAQTAQWR